MYFRLSSRSHKISIAEEYLAILNYPPKERKDYPLHFKMLCKLSGEKLEDFSLKKVVADRLLSIQDTNPCVQLALSLQYYYKIEHHFHPKQKVIYPRSVDDNETRKLTLLLLESDDLKSVLQVYENKKRE